MAVHYADHVDGDLPPEPRLLADVTVRLVNESERTGFDQLLEQEHYLHNATAVGAALRYVAEHRGRPVGLLVFASPALHLKPRERWLGWTQHQLEERRHLLVQNTRFLILPSTGRWPNLASGILKRVAQRLSADWREHFGTPVLAIETFVDPERFKGTCYRSAGWHPLGATQGFARIARDFYLDLKHPKELWVCTLTPDALDQLRAPELDPALRSDKAPPPPPVPLATEALDSFWAHAHSKLKDPRNPRGVRHPAASILALAALAALAGAHTPQAIADFVESLNHGQRRRLRCRPRPGESRQYDVPCSRTFSRFLDSLEPDQLREVVCSWMTQQDPKALQSLYFDGKYLKHAEPAPPRADLAADLQAAAQTSEIPPEEQKPKADQCLCVVNFITPDQRLHDQIAVPSDTNEEAATAVHLPKMDLAGVCVLADAAHTTKANCRQLTQGNGAEYIFRLKGNQPNAFAKVQQLLPSGLPPSGQHDQQGTRPD